VKEEKDFNDAMKLIMFLTGVGVCYATGVPVLGTAFAGAIIEVLELATQLPKLLKHSNEKAAPGKARSPCACGNAIMVAPVTSSPPPGRDVGAILIHEKLARLTSRGATSCPAARVVVLREGTMAKIIRKEVRKRGFFGLGNRTIELKELADRHAFPLSSEFPLPQPRDRQISD